MLEAVEIQQQNREGGCPPALSRRSLFDFLGHGSPVGQAGQRVMMRHEGNVLLRLASLGNVIDDRDQELSVALASHR